MICPRCGNPMDGGICDYCGFPVTKRKANKAIIYMTNKHGKEAHGNKMMRKCRLLRGLRWTQ